MKWIFGVLMLASALTIDVAAQESPSAPAAVPWGHKFFAKENPPAIILHDFGVVPKGTILTHRFEMENIYQVPMQIMSEPKVSCGCVSIVRYTQKMESREKGYIDIQMDSRRFGNDGIGAKTVTITVFFGPKYTSQATLQVRAFSRGDVTLNPGQIQFGAVPQGQAIAAQPLDILYTGKQPDWKIQEVETNNAPIDVSIKPLDRSRGKTTYRLTATLKKDAPTGLLQEHIFLKTNDPAAPILTVSVGATIQAALAAVQGNEQKLDPVTVGEATSRKLMLRGNAPFRILKVEGEANGLTVDYNKTPTPLPVQVVTLHFKPTQAGQLRQQLTIRTDQKDVIAVTVEGVALEP